MPGLVPTTSGSVWGEEEPLTQASGCALGGQPRGRGTASAPGWGSRPGQAQGQGRATWGQRAEGDVGTAGASVGRGSQNEFDNPTSGFLGLKHFL